MNAKHIAGRIVAEDGWCWTCNEAEDDCRCFDESNWRPGLESWMTPRPAAVKAGLIVNAGNDTLEKTLEWIGNLNDAFGRDAVLDHMPNNFGGTIAIQSLIDAGGSGSDESALLQAARYTLENLDAAARDKLISAPRSFQAQLGESVRMLREAIDGQPTPR